MSSYLRDRLSDQTAAWAAARSQKQQGLIRRLMDETAAEAERQEDRFADRSPVSHAAISDALVARGYSRLRANELAAELLVRVELDADQEAADLIASLI